MAIRETRVLYSDWLACFLMFYFFQHAQGSAVGSWGMDLSHWLVVPTVYWVHMSFAWWAVLVSVVLRARLASPCMRDLVSDSDCMHACFYVAL